MAGLLAEHLDHEVGGAVHHLRAVEEVRRAIDEAAEADDADDAVEIADRRLDLRDDVEAALRAALLAFLDRDPAAELAGHQAVGPQRDLPRDGQQRTAAHVRHVIGDGRDGLGQDDAEFGETGGDGGHGTDLDHGR